MAINVLWHKRNPMPKNADMNQRIQWHMVHSKQCACRDIPDRLKQEMVARGMS